MPIYTCLIGWGEFQCEADIDAPDIFRAAKIALDRYKAFKKGKMTNKAYKKWLKEWDRPGQDIALRIWNEWQDQ